MTLMYRFDVQTARIRRWIKHLLPHWLRQKIDSNKHKRRHPRAVAGLLLGGGIVPPWTSPNVWREIVQFYSKIDRPVVFEFGTGASSVHHFANLLRGGGGTYIGVEIDTDWLWVVMSAMVRRAAYLSQPVEVRVLPSDEQSDSDIDVEIDASGTSAILMLRSNELAYLSTLGRECDVVVVDGAFRKACIQRVLTTNFLCEGGLLMLHDAGRGSAEWWEGNLDGENDYSVEVTKLLALGGKVLHGDGLDRWPQCRKRFPRPVSCFYSLEACMLIRPGDQPEKERDLVG